MDLALARIRDNVGRLRGPVQPSVEPTLPRRIAALVRVPHLRHCLGAALAVGVVGIGVNALLLQHERHPAPLFGSAPAPRPAPAVAAVPPPKPAAVEHSAPSLPSLAAPPPTLPPARPAAANTPASPDPIAALLAGEARGDGSHLVLAAQTALMKLGYPVKPDGDKGAATEQALRDFQRAHGLPPSTTITERLVRQLTEAARGAGR